MSRIALISDVHGNLAGFNAVLADAEACGCDRMVCLGDLVDGGPDDAQVVREIMARRIPCVRGNHDEINGLTLPPDIERYLASLPEEMIEGDYYFTHISPRPKKNKIGGPIEAWNVFDEHPYRMMFFGHIHVPAVYGEKSSHAVTARDHKFQYQTPYALDRADRYLICPGAIGYSRDQHQKIRYAIFDEAPWTIEIRMVEGPLLKIGRWFVD
ncbi:MAG: metallophosphoesterase family protein [Candidatus Sumerlaeia bacterium]